MQTTAVGIDDRQEQRSPGARTVKPWPSPLRLAVGDGERRSSVRPPSGIRDRRWPSGLRRAHTARATGVSEGARRAADKGCGERTRRERRRTARTRHDQGCERIDREIIDEPACSVPSLRDLHDERQED